MKKIYLIISIVLFTQGLLSQHEVIIHAKVNFNEKTIEIKQDIIFQNNTPDTIKKLVLNDWNNAFSTKKSALAKRFSDEFIRSFHLAKPEDRGFTNFYGAMDEYMINLNWYREETIPDILYIELQNPIYPYKSKKITLHYQIKVPNEKFTKYGFKQNEKIYLKDWILTPALYQNKMFVVQSNENLDDMAQTPTNYFITFEVPKEIEIASNLELLNKCEDESQFNTFDYSGYKLNEAIAVLSTEKKFTNYKNNIIEVCSNLDSDIDEIDKVLIIDKITRFIDKKIGSPSFKKLLVSKEDYNRQPFYGLNQLPSFFSPFPDKTIFELMFLKTYLNNYLKASLQMIPRKDQWILDGIQVFLMMDYIEENHPNLKMTGNLSKIKLLKSYHFINLEFNQQYNYFYMLMARKNLDQPLSYSKNKLIKFNEQIANKYRAGLCLKYLDSYLENETVLHSINEFINLNKSFQTNSIDFKNILEKNSSKDINWFFKYLINTREVIDYKFGKIKKEKDNLIVTVKNKTGVNVPISLYRLNDKEIIDKIWLENIKTDTTFVLSGLHTDRLSLNYENEIPEFNVRNNWKKINGFFFNNRPFKLNFYKDLEDPYYNQIFYVPEFEFNLYDGIALGVRINNKSLLNKPINFSFAPYYSSNTGKIIGNFSGGIDQFVRDDSKLYRITYSLSGNQSHYAPNAKYTRIIPAVKFSFRDKDLRSNKYESILIRQLFIDREKNPLENTSNQTTKYSVFSASYANSQSESTKHFFIKNQIQISNSFGNITNELYYRKLFDNNRQLTLRLFSGNFIYRSTGSNLFSFGLDRPSDYTFQTNLLGRSESTGLFSQEYVYAEGGFKSKLDTRYANQWMTTINGSFNVWNWIEIYGDIGLLKNKYSPAKFVFDSGIHLNLVPDYFELFFPIYSSNGYEISKENYQEKIRFLITISPKTLISLFTRKWF